MRLSFPRSWSLAVKLPLTITAVVAGVGLTISALIAFQDWRWFNEELEEHVLLLTRAVAVTMPETILRNDYWSLYKDLKKMTSNAPGESRDFHVISAMVLDSEGKVLAHLDPAVHPLNLSLSPESPEDRRLMDAALNLNTPAIFRGGKGGNGFVEGVFPIFSDEKRLAVVRLRVSTDELFAQTRMAVLTVLGLTLGLVAAGSLLGALISRRMVRPLIELAQGMESLGRGELDSITPVSTHDQDEIGKLAVTFNNMAVEMAEKKVLEEQMAVSEKLVALGRITAGVAHEVNNPLAGLLNCIDTLRRHPEDPEIFERYLPLLDKGLNRIKDIVESLLVGLRVEDAHDEVAPSCLEDLRGIIEAEIDGKDIHFTWENNLDDRLRINGRRVQQVVLNLLKNAVQALPKGGDVTFRSFQDGSCMILEVNDNGPGIPQEFRSQLFDPFFTTKHNGTGLGLWIVYRLVESMRGIIEVESEVGRGTQFQVTLPVTEI